MFLDFQARILMRILRRQGGERAISHGTVVTDGPDWIPTSVGGISVVTSMVGGGDVSVSVGGGISVAVGGIGVSVSVGGGIGVRVIVGVTGVFVRVNVGGMGIGVRVRVGCAVGVKVARGRRVRVGRALVGTDVEVSKGRGVNDGVFEG